MIGAGELDQRIRIERPDNTPNGRGGVVKGWAEVATVWARVRPVSGRELAASGQIEAAAVYRIAIRRRTDVTAGCRIVWQGKAMNVRFTPDTGSRTAFIFIDCEAGVPI
ncbi:phage head closure protein [Azospirillum agricola]|uniref:phage head closure protein n=1 Tax=Azospirillum agricola TaxID=1720247 RepID=UPI000A0F06D0|nr:phage head closure protein [Azospirillum agricola]SMH30565.1 phage head-tail adaptor, putative, SPP1 family [Azospirillum lipoferum]